MVQSFCSGVASPFIILTPRLANRQVLPEVRVVVGIWVEGSLVREFLGSLRAFKTRLGFKGCIPAPSYA